MVFEKQNEKSNTIETNKVFVEIPKDEKQQSKEKSQNKHEERKQQSQNQSQSQSQTLNDTIKSTNGHVVQKAETTNSNIPILGKTGSKGEISHNWFYQIINKLFNYE